MVGGLPKPCLLALEIVMMIGGCLLAQTPKPAGAVHLSAEEDHARTMKLLHISQLRPGADADPKAPNGANYDESKAGPSSQPPALLIFKNGSKVTTAELWWTKRRPEIVEDFDREIYGRVPY